VAVPGLTFTWLTILIWLNWLRDEFCRLKHQQKRVESAFILIRSKCKDSTSFARQTAEEAEVAAAMRAGRDETALLGNATLNSTNTSLPQ